MSVLTPTQKDELMGNLDAVIQDSEELLKATAGHVGDNATAMRQRVRARLDKAKDSLHELQHTAVEKAKAAGHRTDDYVHDHPWESVGIAAGIGLLMGILISRR